MKRRIRSIGFNPAVLENTGPSIRLLRLARVGLVLVGLSLGLAGCAVAGAVPGAGAVVLAISLALAAAGCSSGGGGGGKKGGGDTTETPTFSISGGKGREGDGSIVFTVTRNGGAGSASVDWETQDGKAVAGEDYEAGHGTLSFEEGGAAQKITVDLIDDGEFEWTEKFSVVLSSGDDVTFGTDSAEGAILNDESKFQVANLDGNNGFTIPGVDATDPLGSRVSSAGDVNGDGYDDLIVGAPRAEPLTQQNYGASYVVFGKASGFEETFDLGNLDGTNGFAILGVANDDFSGTSVSSAGDVNGDGYDDLIVGAGGADPGLRYQAGTSYVVFGAASFASGAMDLNALDGGDGFAIFGVANGDHSGNSVSSAGDVNGDGYADVLIGAPYVGADAGASYVVFGKHSFETGTIELSALDGGDGFVIPGLADDDYAGFSVSSAGDVNGDGYDDLLIGAYLAGGYKGTTYVVFGKQSAFAPSFDLNSLDGSNGFAILGVAAYDRSGFSVSSAGDVNGDGYDDLIVGAKGESTNGDGSGSSYVVFGAPSFASGTIELSELDGTDGFAIRGVAADDFSGASVSSAGDANGDGYDDLIIGAPFSSNNGNGSGSSYVVFGKASFASTAGTFDLADLDGSNGFAIPGLAAGDYSGISVSSAGDVNGDGYDDLIIGAPSADPNGDSSGAAYVIFGGLSD